jgi:hypothetical protein
MSRLTAGMYGCPLCDEPPPHSHQLPPIFNSRYYCPDGKEHAWQPRRWRKPICSRCCRIREKAS